jgi:GTP-binding protein EngB required for normal cell division
MSEQQSVLLFGRTGYGKSSIANMLVQGDIYQNKNIFTISDSAKGETLNIYSSSTEKYQVFDTVGLGEPPSHPVSHKNAVNEIRNYFSNCKVSLNYIFYVQKKGRISEEDKRMFKLFKEIFEWGEKKFVIIITNSKPDWIEKNLATITEDLGKYPIISVDFPFTDKDEEDIIACDHRKKRVQSLQRLENKLLELKYKSTKLEVLSSTQMTEKNVSKVVSIVPVVGSVYQLISSGVYYTLEKPNNAKERLIDGAVGLTLDTMSVVVAGASKSVPTALFKDVFERISYEACKEVHKLVKDKISPSGK